MLLLFLATLVADEPATRSAWHPFPWAYSLLEGEDREATDVIVVGGERFDRHVIVIECWTGTFRPGTKLSIPMLRAYAPEQERAIFWASCFGLGHADPRDDEELRKAEKESPGHVSGRRIIVLLERKSHLNQQNDLLLNAPENEDKSLRDFLPVSPEALVWADKGHLYGHRSAGPVKPVLFNPRDLIDQGAVPLIFSVGITESQLKDRVATASETRQRLAGLSTISNPLSRARAAVRIVHGQPNWARREALAAISSDAPAAGRLMQSLLADDSMLDAHGDILLVLATVENHEAVADIKLDLDRQVGYWAQHGADNVDGPAQAAKEQRLRLTALYQTLAVLIMQAGDARATLPSLKRLSAIVEKHGELGQFKLAEPIRRSWSAGSSRSELSRLISEQSLDRLLKWAMCIAGPRSKRS